MNGYKVAYDVRTAPDVQPPSPEHIGFAWLVSVASLCLGLVLYVYREEVRQTLTVVQFILIMIAVYGPLYGPVVSFERRAAPYRQREQDNHRQWLEDGDYTVTEGEAIRGSTYAGRLSRSWVKIGDLSFHQSVVINAIARSSRSYLRVSHRGGFILRVEKRLEEVRKEALK
jgi:hypothetical protein